MKQNEIRLDEDKADPYRTEEKIQRRKKVSIITVTLNSENTIARTLESVLSQTYGEIEYWIVDGMSEDRTWEIVQGYAEKFRKKGICYHTVSGKDKGIYDAMNKGIRLASGEIIGMINSDDWYEPHAVETAASCMEDGNWDVVYGDLRIHHKDRHMIKKARYRAIATTRDWNHPTMFVRKAVYDKLQYKNHNLHDDWEFMLRLRKEGYRIRTIPEVLANFSFGGESNTNSKSVMEKIEEKYAAYKENGYSVFYWLDCAAIVLAKELWKGGRSRRR